MTKVKICGITNLEDALLSAKVGADALGFNFYEKSPRYIEPVAARGIIDQLPDSIQKVGVFVNESLENILGIVKDAGLDIIQLHGDESPEFVSDVKDQCGLKIIKAFRISSSFKQNDVLQYDVGAILLDSFSAEGFGGTGERFNWSYAKDVQALFPDLYLAGGLDPENIADAITEVRPYAVDVCSGVELKKGQKDHAKVEAFIRNVRRAI
jgi:phosphoribosylanthranilate isomerase